MKKLWNNLRFRLMIFVLIAALPALGLTLFTGFEQREQAAHEVQQEALRLTRFAALNQESIIQNTFGFLVALSHVQSLEAGGLQDCGKVFSHLQVAHYPYYTGFYVADLEGNILCNAPPEDEPEDLNECVFYQEILRKKDFVLSEYHFCNRTGKAVISLKYPILDENEVFIGVASAGIDLTWFNDLAAEANLPPGGTLIALDQGGIILVHYPEPESWVGKPFPDNALHELMIAQGEGTTEALGTDGAPHLFAFTSLPSSEGNVFVSISIPTDVAYAEANRTMIRNLALIGGATVLALFASLLLGEAFVLRKTRALVAATQRLASGNLDTRTNIPYEEGEIGQLAQSFDQMAMSLEQREEERQRAEAAIREYAEELERSNRDLQDFANIASHDLQEPLRKIQIFSDLLLAHHEEKLDERGMDYLKRMQSASRRMQNLIDDLLTYSRISTRAQPFTFVDLNEVVHEVLMDLDLQIEETGAQIEVSELDKVEADPIQMNQLFQNLLINALKFRKKDQHPKIKIQKCTIEKGLVGEETNNGKICQFSVEDDGIGFDQRLADRIFNPFQRLHSREDYEGSGIGLAICRKIVERHGGSITATSKKGKGSAFVVTLPYHQPRGENGR
jgi:signal transduction histidine kinase